MAGRLLDLFRWDLDPEYRAQVRAEAAEPRDWSEWLPEIDMARYLEGYAERLPAPESAPRPEAY